MITKKNAVLALLILLITISQSFTTFKRDEDEKPTNLKILQKDISEDELHHVMREYSRALGVKCGFCHERKEGQKHADFASDNKPEKLVAREMMLMVNDINNKYLATAGKGRFEKISCVTCHMGRKVPIISVDSLPKNPNQRDPKKIPLHINDTIKAPQKQ
jgi:cytochrome c553